jgi:hypothetical protein
MSAATAPAPASPARNWEDDVADLFPAPAAPAPVAAPAPFDISDIYAGYTMYKTTKTDKRKFQELGGEEASLYVETGSGDLPIVFAGREKVVDGHRAFLPADPTAKGQETKRIKLAAEKLAKAPAVQIKPEPVHESDPVPPTPKALPAATTTDDESGDESGNKSNEEEESDSAHGSTPMLPSDDTGKSSDDASDGVAKSSGEPARKAPTKRTTEERADELRGKMMRIIDVIKKHITTMEEKKNPSTVRNAHESIQKQAKLWETRKYINEASKISEDMAREADLQNARVYNYLGNADRIRAEADEKFAAEKLEAEERKHEAERKKAADKAAAKAVAPKAGKITAESFAHLPEAERAQALLSAMREEFVARLTKAVTKRRAEALKLGFTTVEFCDMIRDAVDDLSDQGAADMEDDDE